MTVTHKPPVTPAEPTAHGAAASPTATERVVAVLRIAFGLTFLWAFFDKLLGLGFSTGRADDGTVTRFGDAAWINGGSPTEGFLKFGADGPFKGFYNSIAGAGWADGCSCWPCWASVSPSPSASPCGSPQPPERCST